jgi:hypothetical protein
MTRTLHRHLLVALGTILFLSCAPEPGKVSFSFTWEGGEPTQPLWLFGQVVKVNPETGELGQVVAELAGAQEYGSEMGFQFTDVPNEGNLALVLEARADASLESRVLYYGSSGAFSLAPGVDNDVEVPVTMVAAPDIDDLRIEEAVGPEDCPDCYVSTSTVSVSFKVQDGVAVEVANDSEFSVCQRILDRGTDLVEGLSLTEEGDFWNIDGWDLNCGLTDIADGPRSVYVRILDGEGYASQSQSAQVVLDRQAPLGGTVYTSDSGWQLNLQGTLMLTVKDASEMWVEACTGTCTESDDSLPDGILECDAAEGNDVPVNTWTSYQTQGCVRLKADTVERLRVKYRDLARNETPWYVLELAYSNLIIKEAVGPADCPGCYVSTEIVTLEFPASEAVVVQIANDSGFSVCKQTLAPGGSGDGTVLRTRANDWTVEGWNLDCGHEGSSDGPRSVFVRLLDAEGYPSQTLSAQIVLDRQPPTEGVITCVDGKWLIKLETTIQFGVVKADEMWVEACDVNSEHPDNCVANTEGLQPCSLDNDAHIAVNSWTSFTTMGCVRFKDDTMRWIRAKFRDFAGNETDWVEYGFESIVALDLTWVPIAGGGLMMGCSQDYNSCLADEFPVHEVALSKFEMLQTEVTERQYELVTGEKPSRMWQGYVGGDNDPVTCVDWEEAKDFCQFVGGRLPTEAEWEYAARAGTYTKYICGNSEVCLGQIAWTVQNSANHKHPVATKQPNEFGLHDMQGNVWEWTNDLYDADYYEYSPLMNPQGPKSGLESVFRGGCFGTLSMDDYRVSNRGHNLSTYDNGFIGFRCVR